MENEGPTLIAHRGFAGEFPENSLTAITRATQYADGVEVDVHQCATGELVAIHDRWVGPRWRPRRVDRMTRSALSALHRKINGEAVPTIPEVLEAVPTDHRLILELKTGATAEPLTELIDENRGNLLVSSANRRALSLIKRHDPTLSTALVHIPSFPRRGLWPMATRFPGALDTIVDVESLAAEAVALGCNELHVRYELCLQTDIVEIAHETDLAVGAWTVHSPSTFQSLVDAGVDVVIADTWRVNPDRDAITAQRRR